MRHPWLIRILLAAAALAAIAVPSASAQRLDTTRMTCGQARAVVASQGAAVLSSGPNIYDRYVASRSFCSVGETTQPAFVATRDSAACPVGGVCYTPDRHRIFEE